MSTTPLEQINNSIEILSSLVADLELLPCTDEQLRELMKLGRKLEGIGVSLYSKAASKRAWEAGKGLRFKVAEMTSKVISKQKPASPAIFQRSIRSIFGGFEALPQPANLGPRVRKAYEARCERIRNSSPDTIITWALTFSPTSWLSAKMNNDIFSSLLMYIEGRPSKMWPEKVYELLDGLRHDGILAQSPEYSRFVDGESRSVWKQLPNN
jgi:hypothetical protein